jgi:hypothetical protein
VGEKYPADVSSSPPPPHPPTPGKNQSGHFSLYFLPLVGNNQHYNHKNNRTGHLLRRHWRKNMALSTVAANPFAFSHGLITYIDAKAKSKKTK